MSVLSYSNNLRVGLWVRLALLNLVLVAFFGTLMRYKIAFSFPLLEQKNLQHAHSHFAFIGWVTHLLFVLIAHTIARDQPALNVKKYKLAIIANLVCAYGMLISFTTQGYGVFSIILLCLSVLLSYVFSVFVFADLRRGGPKPYRRWFTGAMWFNIISSLGTFSLGYMMATHNFDSKLHLASLYYYLHFQYNGFFFFACIGLLIACLSGLGTVLPRNKRVFWLFFLSCIPAYFLSVLWMKIPWWIYALVIFGAVAQVYAWLQFLRDVGGPVKREVKIRKTAYYVLLLVALALSVKFLLQLGSVVPAISKLAFGFRSVVIAYLHLILLAIISVFLVCYLYVFGFMRANRSATAGFLLFVAGVYINEIIMGIQGIASFSYTIVPYVNEMLFGAAVFILFSLIVLNYSQSGKKAATQKTDAAG